MANATSSNSPRRPWMATAIWGWRLEIVLTLVGMSSRFGPTVRITFGPTLAETATSNLRG